MTYTVNPHYDTDLTGLDEAALERALNVTCTCGHKRSDHYGANGAVASFGGSACAQCWACGTFNPARAKLIL